jgi:preprotein translocase SecE subunit
VARDRQRAKQRRRRQSADGGAAAGPAARPEELADSDPTLSARSGDELDAGRDAGVEDVVDQLGPDGTTPTPDPLKHGSSYVDEAKIAETGVPFDGPVEEAVERAPDDLEYSSAYADSSGREGHAGAVATAPRRGRATTFLRNSAQELKRVQWPDRRHTGQGTAVTLGFVVLAGGFLGLMDAIWRPIVEAII